MAGIPKDDHTSQLLSKDGNKQTYKKQSTKTEANKQTKQQNTKMDSNNQTKNKIQK